MAIIGVPTISALGIPVDTSRVLPVRDPALVGVANSGVRWLSDAAFPWCYPGGSPTGRAAAGTPADGAVIYDMAQQANGSFILPAPGVTFAGGGFDFTSSTALTGSRNVGMVMPASVLADLWTAYGGNSQQFLFSLWVKLPTLANWNTGATLLSMAGDLPYISAASLFILTQKTGGTIEVRRQTAAATYDVTNVMTATPNSDQYGSIVQISVWRNAAGQGLRIKGGAGSSVLVSKAVGPDNTQNFSANPFVVGRNGAAFAGTSATTTISALSGVRFYRAMMENLARSGRDPVTVLDAAYTAVTARNLFS